jgi:hypothetical protein
MTTKDQFDILLEMQREFYSRFIDLAVKIAGFYLLVLGWILTSNDAREYLGDDELARGTAVAVVLIAWIIYCCMAYRLSWLSNRTFMSLQSLPDIPAFLYENYRVTRKTVGIFLIATLVVAYVVGFVLWRAVDQQVGTTEYALLVALVLTVLTVGSAFWYLSAQVSRQTQ